MGCKSTMKKLTILRETILGSQNSAPKNCPNNLGGALVKFLEVQWFRYFVEIMKESGMWLCKRHLSNEKRAPGSLGYIGDEKSYPVML